MSQAPERSRAEIRASFMHRRPGQMGKIEKAKDPRRAIAGLLTYLAPFRWALIATFCLVIVYTLLGLVGPYLMGVAIDTFITGGDADGLMRISLVMLVTYILYNGLHAIANWVMARISQRALKRIRGDLFAHLQTLPLSFFDRNPAGELMSRLTNDIDAINQAVSQNVTALIASVLSMGGILIAMFVLNPWLALATLVVIPVMFFFTRFIASYTRRGFRELQKRLGGLNSTMEESLSGGKVVMAFRRNESALETFRRHNQEVYQAAVYANSYSMLLMPLTSVLGNFFVIVLAGLGGFLAMQGLVSVGIIATFISYGQNFVNPLRMIASIYNAIQAALAGAERVFEIIDTPSEQLSRPSAVSLDRIAGEVIFDDIDFSYIPGTPVIRKMDIHARPGQTIALVGPTGAGKTTIVNLLGRFYEIDSGRITLDGHDIRTINQNDLRRKLGVVLQDTFLFADTVMENIRYGRLDASDEEVIHAARLADADHFIRQLPDQYQTVLTERAGNLSQGQRQMLAIARAILADPAILILDEATSSVDTRTEVHIQNALLRLMEGRTSFVIAHRLSTIRDADNVVVIHNGEVVEQGTHEQLLDRRGFYHRMIISQFKGQPL